MKMVIAYHFVKTNDKYGLQCFSIDNGDVFYCGTTVVFMKLSKLAQTMFLCSFSATKGV